MKMRVTAAAAAVRKGFRLGSRCGFLAALALVPLALLASPARAVTVTNTTTGSTLFHTDFENGLNANPGNATAGPNVFTTLSTTPPDPGPFQGTSYLAMFRDSDTPGQGNYFAHIDPQATPGDTLHLRSMVFLPDDRANARLQMILDDGDFNSARAHVFSSGTGHVMAAIGPAFTPVDTGLTYTPGVWQEWGLDYTIGGLTFDVTVNGVTATGFASHSSGQVSLAELFNGNNTAGTLYLDATPEPAAAGALVLLAVGFTARRRRARTK